MVQAPWLTIIGLGEDGVEGLCNASRNALDMAEVIMAPPRHMAMLPDTGAKRIEWPVPFADGVSQLLELRGRPVAVLASGDPFWFGAGSVLTASLEQSEWTAFPGRSTFSLVAARLGWPLERTACLGLHARPHEELRGMLAPHARAILLLRDGAAVRGLAEWLSSVGFEDSTLTIFEALGGRRERCRTAKAGDFDLPDIRHPVCVALDAVGTGDVLTLASGRSDMWFDSDGQMTKRPMRALTLSALAPKPGDHLWDLGAGAGSISVEWGLCHPSLTATAVELRADRAARIVQNAARFGMQSRIQVLEGAAVDLLKDLPMPQAVFIGGGLSDTLLEALWACLASGVRVVANAVTLESQALLSQWHQRCGGDLIKVELSQAKPLGDLRGWSAAYPVVQWSGRR